MKKLDEVQKAVQDLYDEGKGFLSGTLSSTEYESWYTRALSIIKAVCPARYDDFVLAYKIEKRKVIDASTYTIHDYMIGLRIQFLDEDVFNHFAVFRQRFQHQLNIVKAVADLVPSILRDVHTVLRVEIFDDDIEAAAELLKAKHIRSAGVICGVVLENHLKSIAVKHVIKLGRKKVTLAVVNDALKNNNIYGVPTWRYVQHLADIRNLCAHKGSREPTKGEVEDLIAGSKKILKTVL